MSSLIDSLQFQSMLITDLFKTHKGKRVIAAHREPGNTPFVSGSEFNNSITDFSDIKPLFPGGWLTLTYNGSIGQTRLQPAPFFASDDVIALEPLHEEMTDEIKLVFATLIQHQCVGKFSYANKLNLKRLHQQRIMVPVVSGVDGHTRPDWEAMEILGRELRGKTLASRENAMSTSAYEDVELPELEFAPMLLTDVFPVATQAPAWLNTNAVEKGSPEFAHVTNSAERNSVVGFISHQAMNPNPGNAITIGIDTQSVAYLPAPFYGATKVFVLRAEELNAYNALVLVTVLKQGIEKFSWGYKASGQRLKRTRIMVPVVTTPSGETVPDWEGMTAYGRAMRVRVENAVRAGSPSFQGMSSNA
ncbi:MAG: restriction endonuclease subunit S [Corynebacterium glucuronolyticum]|nr:restriction endonuclease subunit S [Corynebacterium glucuronolyticum]